MASKATYKKKWRKQNYEEKRFNRMLKEYLRVKYENTFEEYCSFYLAVKEENPDAKDLTKTKTFRKWKRDAEAAKAPVKLVTYTIKDPELQSETVSFSGVVQEELHDETITFSGFVQDEHEIVTHPEVEQEPAQRQGPEMNEEPINIEFDQADDIIANIINDLEQDEAVRNTLNAQEMNEEPINIEFDQADDIIANIINDLEQDEAVRNMLNAQENDQPQDADEGIDLNVEDELEYVLFDF